MSVVLIVVYLVRVVIIGMAKVFVTIGPASVVVTVLILELDLEDEERIDEAGMMLVVLIERDDLELLVVLLDDDFEEVPVGFVEKTRLLFLKVLFWVDVLLLKAVGVEDGRLVEDFVIEDVEAGLVDF